MSHRLTDAIEAMVVGTVEEQAQGDDVAWDFCLSATPSGPVGVLFLWMPSGVIGEFLNTSAVWSSPVGVTQQHVDDSVRQMLEGLRAARSDQLGTFVGNQTQGAV